MGAPRREYRRRHDQRIRSDAAATPLYVAAANSKGEPVFLSPTPFTPTPGAATYLTLVMPSGGAPIGNPPAAVGGTAPPKT